MKYIITIVFFAAIHTVSNAQITTDRPDQTESSSTVGKSALQVESGLLVGYEEDGEIISRQILAPSTLFRYGLTSGIELRVLSQWEQQKNAEFKQEGISDLEIGAKVQLLQNDNINLEIAFLSHLLIPTGSPALSQDSYATLNKIAVSHELTDRMGLGYNLGYNYLGEGNGDFTYSLALGYGINENTSVYIEPYGEMLNMEEFFHKFNAGVTYLLKENFQLDFSFGTGLNYEMNYIAAGFSCLLNDLYD